jgi:hypothetical protein
MTLAARLDWGAIAVLISWFVWRERWGVALRFSTREGRLGFICCLGRLPWERGPLHK